MTSSKSRLINWANFTNPLYLVGPLLLAAQWPVLRIGSFTPRQLVYSGDFIPFLLAPWSWPTDSSAVLSRLIQALLLYRLPNTSAAVGCYALWVLTGLARTLSGFLLTRSIGWVYPRLFEHYALYETTGGLGPALIAYLGVTGARGWTEVFTSPCSRYALEDRGSFIVVALAGLLSWLDGAPWTYAMCLASMLGVAFVRAIIGRLTHTRHYHPLALDPEKPPRALPTRFRVVFQTACLCLLVIPQPVLLAPFTYPTPKYPAMPPSPRSPSPLLEVLILSYPRPNDKDFFNLTSSSLAPTSTIKPTSTERVRPPSPAPSSILFTTISSYLPFFPSERDSTARLSVFTHAVKHPAFTHARKWLSPSSSPQHTNVPIEFYVDEDLHPDAHSNQYLHLAEALRWAQGDSTNTHGGHVHGGHIHEAAEWILLVEDDFALCGKWGWEGIVGVMRELEAGRVVVNGTETLARYGGFVATGGSGLIVHRTLLPILSFILRAHASLDSPLPQNTSLRPADLIIQDCLLGLDPLCPRPLSPPASSATQETGGGPLVITSRIVMDHIGSRASTVPGRVYEPGKWRCGWRHPFHGREEVDVVVV